MVFRTSANLALEFYIGKINAYRGFLEKTQWLRGQDIIHLQRNRLRALLHHAYENVPYYHMIFARRNLRPSDIRTVEDLNKLPILRKTDIGKSSQELLAKNLSHREIVPRYTGGTTASPMKFYRTREEIRWSLAAQFRAYGWGGYELGDKYAHIWPLQPFELSNPVFRLRNMLERRRPSLNAADLSERTIRLFLSEIERVKPQFLIGYSSCIYMLSKYLLVRGITPPKFSAIFATSETLFRNQRRTIEDTFRCDVYDHYNSREFTSLACECEEQSGYHVNCENVIVEIVKDNEPVAPGETGTILVTSLHNYAMPFIRYHIGDAGKPSGESCNCGRGLPLIKSLEGRTHEFFKTGDGSIVGLRDLNIFFEDLPVGMFQILQTASNEILVKVVKEDDYSQKDTKFISKHIAWGSPKLKVKVETVDSLPSTKTGKRPYFVSKLPAHDWMD